MKHFTGGIVAVAGVDLEIAEGERVVLVGPSGCGKTTTLRLIAGLESPTSGSVFLDGRDVTREPPHRRDVAFVFQEAALYPHLSVRDNLAFALRLHGASRTEQHSAVDRVSTLLGIADLHPRRPEGLSGGQRARVALGRALIRKPRVLLLDEPLSDLDAPARLELRELLERLHREQPVTTLHVTHDQEEALHLGDRVAVMREGTLVHIDTPTELFNRPANLFVARAVGTPAMNLLPTTRGGRAVVLGIRPRDVRLVSPTEADLVAVVESARTIGHETHLVLRGKGNECIVVVREESVPVGSRVGLRFDAAKVHPFDATSGDLLR